MQDLANSDCIVIQGSNMAEAHPVAFQYVVEAKRRGATVIHVDPRFSRTSALAHRHVGIRAGSDIVFLGAIINYILSNDLHFEEYVRAYTNGPVILRDDFQDVDELDGVFSGYDPDTASYDNDTWMYAETDDGTCSIAPVSVATAWSSRGPLSAATAARSAVVVTSPSASSVTVDCPSRTVAV